MISQIKVGRPKMNGWDELHEKLAKAFEHHTDETNNETVTGTVIQIIVGNINTFNINKNEENLKRDTREK